MSETRGVPSRRFTHLLLVTTAVLASSLAAPTSIAGASTDAELVSGVPVIDGTLPDDVTIAPLNEVRSEPGAVTGHRAAAAGGGIFATFAPGTPEEVGHVARVALDHWDAALGFDPAVPVEVHFRWEDLGDRVLGYGGPTWFVVHPDLGPETWPVALANTLSGVDQNTASPEIVIGLNSRLDWHLDPATSPPSDQPDLLTTILHEVGHGLGFVSSLTLEGDGLDPNLRLRFDRALRSPVGGALVPIAELDEQARSASLTASLVAVATDGSSWPMYTPAQLSIASSISHFDEDLHPHGSAGSLMSPAQRLGEAERGLDGPTISVMAAIGWPIDAPPATPTGVTTIARPDGVEVRWAFDHRRADRPAERVTVTATTADGPVEVVVDASAGRALVPGASIADTFEVSATAAGAVSPAVRASGPDAATIVVEALYRAAFDRTPDRDGLAFWADEVRAGTPLTTIASHLVASPEYAAGLGQLAPGDFVDHLYRSVLARRPDPVGRSFWTAELLDGRDRGELIAAFVDTAELLD